MAFFLAMLMFSLAGMPPLAGFFAKFYVFLAAVEAGLYPLAVIGVLLSAVGAYLLSAHRQDHVFRRAGARRSTDAAVACARVLARLDGLLMLVLLALSGAV